MADPRKRRPGEPLSDAPENPELNGQDPAETDELDVEIEVLEVDDADGTEDGVQKVLLEDDEDEVVTLPGEGFDTSLGDDGLDDEPEAPTPLTQTKAAPESHTWDADAGEIDETGEEPMPEKKAASKPAAKAKKKSASTGSTAASGKAAKPAKTKARSTAKSSAGANRRTKKPKKASKKASKKAPKKTTTKAGRPAKAQRTSKATSSAKGPGRTKRSQKAPVRAKATSATKRGRPAKKGRR